MNALTAFPRRVKFIGIEGRVPVTRAWGKFSSCLMGAEFVWEDERNLEMDDTVSSITM